MKRSYVPHHPALAQSQGRCHQLSMRKPQCQILHFATTIDWRDGFSMKRRERQKQEKANGKKRLKKNSLVLEPCILCMLKACVVVGIASL